MDCSTAQNKQRGLIQIYTGEGKGKTTAALGLALRASGQGLKVVMVQFVKGERTGEHLFLQKYPAFEIIQPNGKSCFAQTRQELEAAVAKTIETAGVYLADTTYDMVILDEIFVALEEGFLTTARVIELIDLKPESTELILTGRHAPPEIVQRADLVTEMLMIKHPFTEGIVARRGIEY